MLIDDSKRTIPEAYESAANAKSLVVTPGRSDGDMLIAAGLAWNDARMGLLLMRLQSEWESSATPRRPARLGEKDAKDKRLKQMHDAAMDAYSNELALFRCSLKALPETTHQLCLRASRKNIPADIPGPVLAWWLDQACEACGGLGKTIVPGSNCKSSHNCQPCRGVGKRHRPGGQQGQRISDMLDACVQTARAALRGKLTH